jgi:hypothetical protein
MDGQKELADTTTDVDMKTLCVKRIDLHHLLDVECAPSIDKGSSRILTQVKLYSSLAA